MTILAIIKLALQILALVLPLMLPKKGASVARTVIVKQLENTKQVAEAVAEAIKPETHIKVASVEDRVDNGARDAAFLKRLINYDPNADAWITDKYGPFSEPNKE